MNDIKWVMDQLQKNARVTRTAWGANTWIGLKMPSYQTIETVPYLFMRTEKGDISPWFPNAVDLLATDWLVNEQATIYANV